MKILSGLSRWPITLALVSVLFSLGACSRTVTFSADSFVGVWKSSRSPDTPIAMYDNGEWEVKSVQGQVTQYGVWQIVGQNKIMWSYRNESGHIVHEVNPVISVTPSEFKVQELDNSATTFIRIS